MKLKIPTLVLLLRVMSASSSSLHGKHKTGNPGVERGSPEFWYHLIVSAFLVLAGGVFAGCVFFVFFLKLIETLIIFGVFQSLTLGLMGLDELHLRVLATSSEDLRQKRDAQKGPEQKSWMINPRVYIHWCVLKKKNSIEAYAKGKTLGPSGTSPPVSVSVVIIFISIGSSISQRRTCRFSVPEKTPGFHNPSLGRS